MIGFVRPRTETGEHGGLCMWNGCGVSKIYLYREMISKDNGEKACYDSLNLKLAYEQRLNYTVNLVRYGKLFRNKTNCLVIGGKDGVIRVYSISKPGHCAGSVLQLQSLLETKSGPVQAVCLCDVTKFGSTDMIVGDSVGNLTIFANEQILNRRTLSEGCITAITIDHDLAGNLAIVMGDTEGSVTAVSPYNSLWKLRLQDIGKHVTQDQGTKPSVRCMLSVSLPTAAGTTVNYVLVADSCKNLYFLQNGTIVYKLTAPSAVTAMTAGYFMVTEPNILRSPIQSLSSPRRQSSHMTRQTQVALGTEDGGLFILTNFRLCPYANVHLPITQLEKLQASFGEGTDILLCIGHFNAIMGFHQQELVLHYPMRDWVHTMTSTVGEQESKVEIIVGLMDNTIQSFELTS